jgi:hypothetical protein
VAIREIHALKPLRFLSWRSLATACERRGVVEDANMRYGDDDRESDMVEDRRGQGGGMFRRGGAFLSPSAAAASASRR